MFTDQLTILNEDDLIAIFSSISEMQHLIQSILLRQSTKSSFQLESSFEDSTDLKLDEIF